MADESTRTPNPKRVAAGRRNRQLWTGFSPAGLQRLRQHALRNRPWEHSTGPRSAAGKARAAANGRVRQKGPRSVREVRATLADVRELVAEMRIACRAAEAL